MSKLIIEDCLELEKIKRVKVFLNHILLGWGLTLPTKKRMIHEIIEQWLIESNEYDIYYDKIINKYKKEIHYKSWKMHTYAYKPRIKLDSLLQLNDTNTQLFTNNELYTLYCIENEINKIRMISKKNLETYILKQGVTITGYFKNKEREINE